MRTTSLSMIGMLFFCAWLPAQDAETDAAVAERYAAFEKKMANTVFVGTFTMDGDESQNRRPERYEIRRVTKLERGDYWSFFARIAYGDHDVTVPVPVEIKWAGTTPVITVDAVAIPGLGTFDARVLISDDKYAGTWRHGEVGGLLFGRIEKQGDEQKQEKEQSQEKADDAKTSEAEE